MDKVIYDRIRKIVYEESGISLGNNKEALVSSRVSKRMRNLGLTDFQDYIDYLQSDRSEVELVHLIDVISTNVTSFFREEGHFVFMKDVITKWLENGQRKFRIWSSACSTGEEPYTIAMALYDIINGMNVDLKILATDISTKVLDRCKLGIYNEDKIKEVPDHFKKKYFDRTKEQENYLFSIKENLKKLIVFKRLNLSEPPFPMKGPMDIIFCRNVMIYFDNITRRKLLNEIFKLLKPGGFLMVGHAESLTGMMLEIKTVKPSIYMKN
jgi:chemotaxis protein methyltransferase CheR